MGPARKMALQGLTRGLRWHFSRKDRADCYSGSLADIGRLGALLTLDDLELNPVAFFQALVAIAGDRTVMNEHIGSVVPTEKPIALGVIEPLDRPL